MSDFDRICDDLGFTPPPDRIPVVVTAVVQLASRDLQPAGAFIFNAHPDWYAVTDQDCLEASIAFLEQEIVRLLDPEA